MPASPLIPVGGHGLAPTAKGRVLPRLGKAPVHKPLIEIARADGETEALTAVEAGKERHPKAAAHLQPLDVLVEKMRGSSSLWYRVRINLEHVPARQRPKTPAARREGPER